MRDGRIQQTKKLPATVARDPIEKYNKQNEYIGFARDSLNTYQKVMWRLMRKQFEPEGQDDFGDGFEQYNPNRPWCAQSCYFMVQNANAGRACAGAGGRGRSGLCSINAAPCGITTEEMTRRIEEAGVCVNPENGYMYLREDRPGRYDERRAEKREAPHRGVAYLRSLSERNGNVEEGEVSSEPGKATIEDLRALIPRSQHGSMVPQIDQFGNAVIPGVGLYGSPFASSSGGAGTSGAEEQRSPKRRTRAWANEDDKEEESDEEETYDEAQESPRHAPSLHYSVPASPKDEELAPATQEDASQVSVREEAAMADYEVDYS